MSPARFPQVTISSNPVKANVSPTAGLSASRSDASSTVAGVATSAMGLDGDGKRVFRSAATVASAPSSWAGVVDGDRRPMVRSQPQPRAASDSPFGRSGDSPLGRSVCCIVIGAQRSTVDAPSVPWKPAGATPITSKGAPLS
jgi:hypothetical protein